MVSTIHQRVELGLCDVTKPAKLYVDDDGVHYGALLEQDGTAVAMIGRPMLITEAKQEGLNRLLVGVVWALKKLGRYCNYLP